MKIAKKISLAIVVALVLASFTGIVSFADNENIALGAEPIYGTYSHLDGNWNWNINNINDGDVYEIGHNPDNGGGTASGYHSAFGQSMPEPQWIGFNFGEKKTFNTVIVYPVNTNTFPIDFEIQVSHNGESWTPIVSEKDYSITTYSTDNAHGYVPQTFKFDTQNAQYVRLYATKLNFDGAHYAMKLTEIEVFNVTEEAPAGPENLALRKKVDSDSSHYDDITKTWGLQNINDGDRVNLATDFRDYGQFTGYHTSPNTPTDGSDAAKAQFTIELGEGTAFNQVVIYPSNELHSIKRLENRSDDPNNPDGLYFPENFRIQYSDDGETWKDALVKTDYQATIDPQVFEFDTVTAKYVRFQMENLTHFVKLTEFEVYNIPEDFTLTSGTVYEVNQGNKITVTANADITGVDFGSLEVTSSDYSVNGDTLVINSALTSKLDAGTYKALVKGANGEVEITFTVSAPVDTGDSTALLCCLTAFICLAGVVLVCARRKRVTV